MDTTKDEALAMVSHELRVPLMAILAWTEVLGHGPLDPDRSSRAIRAIERNATAMRRIIEDLQHVSEELGGRATIAAEPVDLLTVIREAVDDVHPAAKAAGLPLTLACGVASPAVVGDVLRLRQIVVNLLVNAVKFTPTGGRIDVTLRPGPSGFEIRVADTGRGIRPEFLPRIFDRFVRDDTVPQPIGGLGLGLLLVKALVERQGGTVHAESGGLGQGATFFVQLPAFVDPATVPGPQANGHVREPRRRA